MLQCTLISNARHMVSLDYHDNLHFSVSDCKRHGCEYAGAAAREEERIPFKFGG